VPSGGRLVPATNWLLMKISKIPLQLLKLSGAVAGKHHIIIKPLVNSTAVDANFY
jgi:hypothetical protein